MPGSGRSGSLGPNLQLQGNELWMGSEEQTSRKVDVGRAQKEFKGSFLLTWQLKEALMSIQRMRNTLETGWGRAWAGEGYQGSGKGQASHGLVIGIGSSCTPHNTDAQAQTVRLGWSEEKYLWYRLICFPLPPLSSPFLIVPCV